MPDAPLSKPFAWPPGGGMMGKLIRELDWKHHAMGPPSQWPESLRTALSICLNSRSQIFLWWGPDLRVLYNDAYAPTLGVKHPAALGEPGGVVWHEIWPVIQPMLQSVLDGGEATWSDNERLFLERSGYPEETYHTFSYSPIFNNDNRADGIFCAVSETTERVLAERRLHTLREVSARTAAVRTVLEACEAALAAMAERDEDIPFALIYLRDKDQRLTLSGQLRLTAPSDAAPATCDAAGAQPWPMRQALETGQSVVVRVADTPYGALPGGAWPESPEVVLIMPLPAGEGQAPLGALVIGINPRRRLDDPYRGFLDMLADQISTAIARSRASEEEERRAAALAALDRAKTAFFGNVSHEFRTPLTLMLGPVEDLLMDTATDAPGRANLQLLHRNAQRLLKLVNTLLDFSRIEAGRTQASFRPTDLAALTTDLASAFRSAMERANLVLHVECETAAEMPFVDQEMWEKIVLNLLSNAFKYTLEGGVNVSLNQSATHVTLTVEDTGVGIPDADLPRLFERFHRVQGTHGRSFEGTGIGLALVHELVKLHGGVVTVTSEVGRGTKFAVVLPMGSAHLPAHQVAPPAAAAGSGSGTGAFVEEALRWLPEPSDDGSCTPLGGAGNGAAQSARADAVNGDGVAPKGTASSGGNGVSEARETALGPGAAALPLIILADDNADMRAYLERLLSHEHRVWAVANGMEALAAIKQERPHLIISDVMMPVLDGFGLLAKIRADPELRVLPVILLSARAGEEARIEGLAAGADDYLVKPFSARELTARVFAHLQLAKLRAEAEVERERLLARERLAVQYRDEFLGIASHELRTPVTSLRMQLELTQRVLERSGGDMHAVPEQRFTRMMRTFSHQLTNLSHLIDDLLDVSRIANGRLTVDPVQMDLVQVARRVLDLCQEQLDQAKCALSFAHEEALPGFWDPKRLEQVFVNLLSNATKYAAGQKVYMGVHRHGDRAVIVVRDEGMGIAPEHQGKIFQRFERAVGRANISGLGLGLYIVREIIRAHGGDISVSSVLGHGSEFRVQLPILSTRSLEIKPPQVAAKARLLG